MNRIFQNIDYIELEISSSDGRTYFPKDRLYNEKQIQRIFFFGHRYNLGTTPAGEVSLDSNINEYLDNVTVNLYGLDSERVVKSMTASVMQPGNSQDIFIGRKLDWTLCYAEYSGIPSALVGSKIICAVQYQTRIPMPVLDPTDVRGIIIPAGQSGDISLYDYLGHELDGKQISRISIKTEDCAYISLRDRYGRVFSEVPCVLFSQYGQRPAFVAGYPEMQYVDALDIDMQNSWIHAPNGLSADMEITLYYV
jgi:hypothetical protein